ncbi:hypothetical protein Btru_052726 [Bulinus truncatus]|nr:hypothetical protein Btru_052726 [Bulinus truncatus]
MVVWWTGGQAQVTDQQCYLNRDIFEPDAKVRFAFMISLRKKDTSKRDSDCALINQDAFQNYLAAEWIVERMNRANNGTGYIPNVKFGFDVLDDCQSPEAASRNALTLVENWLPSWVKNCSKPATALNIGIIGPSRSRTALRVANLLRDINVTMISFAATVAELSNKANYPTFLRSVPSDEDQMTMIANLLKQLNWTYVAIIHKSNEYGTSGAKVLQAKSEALGICIQRVLAVEDFNIKQELNLLLDKAKDFSLAIVFIGSRDDAENLLFTINTFAPMNPKSKYGFHLILSDSANVDSTIYKDKDYGFGTFSVGTTDLILEDYISDMKSKYRRVRNKLETHNLFEEYIKDYAAEDLFPDNQHNTFVPMTIHAIFTLIEAFKSKYNELCGGTGTICSELLDSLHSGDMVNKAFAIQVNYGDMDENVPPDLFKRNKYVVSFDANGNMMQTNNIPLYTVYQYQKQYVPVGYYANNILQLNMSLIQMATPNGGAITTTVPTSVCNGQCDTCLTRGKIPIARMNGEFYIVGVFSIHDQGDKPSQCGKFRNFSNDVFAVEGFFYAVRQLSSKTGINFGAIAIDDCYSPIRATTILSSYFYDQMSNNQLFDLQVPLDKVVGVVGCLSSSCTIATASYFMPQKIPVISYASSTPDLDDKINFPYFLRTVPSDVFQAKVMLRVIQTLKWQYVGLIYVKNNYGTKGMKYFKSLAMAENTGVCVAEEIGIGAVSSELDERDFALVYSKLLEQQVKVVVFFGIHARFTAFLSYLENNRYGKFIFIGSEDWGKYDNILSAAPKATRGSLTLKLEEFSLDSGSEFQSYMEVRVPTVNDTNIWFSEFWQSEFSCNIKGGFINTFDRYCDESLKMNPANVSVKCNDQRVTHAMSSVYALGYGWIDARNNECEKNTDCLRQKVDKVIEKIKAIKRREGTKQYSIFDADGNGDIGFAVYNVQIDGEKKTYFKVGSFNNKDSCFQTKDLLFYSDSGKVTTEYSAPCSQLLCARCPKFYPNNQNAMENTLSGPTVDYRNSDILLISLIIVLILAVAVAGLAFWISFSVKYRALKKELESKKDQGIYAEPDGEYQPYSATHIKFANAEMDPYHVDEVNTTLLRGRSNLGFVPDNPDSLSQVLWQRNRSSSELPSRSNTICNSFSRRLPVSPIGHNNMNEMQDNQSYVESASDINYLPSVTTSSQIAHNSNNSSVHPDVSLHRRSVDVQSFTDAHLVLTPNGGQAFSDGVVHYKKDSDDPVMLGAPPTHRALSQQPSVRSNSSLINPEFGPYSYAAAQQKRLQNQNNPVNQQSLREMNMQSSNLNEQDGNQCLPQSQRENYVQYFPNHYASTPIVSGQIPGPQVMSIPQFHPSLNEYIMQQQNNSGGQALEMSTMNQTSNSQQAMQEVLLNEQRMAVRPQYENSNISQASAPDHLNTPHDIQQQISMESIDLNSNNEAANDVRFSPASPATNNNKFLSRLFRGNVTHV